MRAAITGGDSPIGRALQKVLRARGVAFCSLFPTEPPAEIAALGEVLVGEETDAEKVRALLDGASALFHVGRAHASPSADVCQAELAGQATLIPAAHERGIELHYLSSSEVFTPPANPSTESVGEDAPVAPASPLGVAKVTWEQTLRIWGEHKGLRSVVYRIPIAVPEYLVYTSVSARYLQAGIRLGEIFPHAHQEGRRWGMSYVHSEDVAQAMANAVGRAEWFGQTFHLAADHWISEHDLAELSYRVLCDFMIPCKWRPPLSDTPAGLVGDVWLNNAKARRMLNLDVTNSMPRLVTKLRLWVDDFASTARLRVAK